MAGAPRAAAAPSARSILGLASGSPGARGWWWRRHPPPPAPCSLASLLPSLFLRLRASLTGPSPWPGGSSPGWLAQQCLFLSRERKRDRGLEGLRARHRDPEHCSPRLRRKAAAAEAGASRSTLLASPSRKRLLQRRASGWLALRSRLHPQRRPPPLRPTLSARALPPPAQPRRGAPGHPPPTLAGLRSPPTGGHRGSHAHPLVEEAKRQQHGYLLACPLPPHRH